LLPDPQIHTPFLQKTQITRAVEGQQYSKGDVMKCMYHTEVVSTTL